MSMVRDPFTGRMIPAPGASDEEFAAWASEQNLLSPSSDGPPLSIGRRALEFAKGIPRGGIGTVGAMLQGSELITRNLQRSMGFYGASRRRGPVFQAGESLQQIEALKPQEGYEDLFTTHLGDALGSLASFAIPGMAAGRIAGATVGRGAARAAGARAATSGRGINIEAGADAAARMRQGVERMAQFGTAAPMAGTAGAAETYQNAMQFIRDNPQLEMDSDDALRMSPRGVVPGIVQIATLGPMLRLIPKAQKRGAIGYVARRMAETGVTEFTVENLGAVLQNRIRQSYDPNHELMQDVPYRGTPAGVAAAMLQLITYPLLRRSAIARGKTPDQLVQEMEGQINGMSEDLRNAHRDVGRMLETAQSLGVSESEVQRITSEYFGKDPRAALMELSSLVDQTEIGPLVRQAARAGLNLDEISMAASVYASNKEKGTDLLIDMIGAAREQNRPPTQIPMAGRQRFTDPASVPRAKDTLVEQARAGQRPIEALVPEGAVPPIGRVGQEMAPGVAEEQAAGVIQQDRQRSAEATIGSPATVEQARAGQRPIEALVPEGAVPQPVAPLTAEDVAAQLRARLEESSQQTEQIPHQGMKERARRLRQMKRDMQEEAQNEGQDLQEGELEAVEAAAEAVEAAAERGAEVSTASIRNAVRAALAHQPSAMLQRYLAALLAAQAPAETPAEAPVDPQATPEAPYGTTEDGSAPLPPPDGTDPSTVPWLAPAPTPDSVGLPAMPSEPESAGDETAAPTRPIERREEDPTGRSWDVDPADPSSPIDTPEANAVARDIPERNDEATKYIFGAQENELSRPFGVKYSVMNVNGDYVLLRDIRDYVGQEPRVQHFRHNLKSKNGGWVDGIPTDLDQRTAGVNVGKMRNAVVRLFEGEMEALWEAENDVAAEIESRMTPESRFYRENFGNLSESAQAEATQEYEAMREISEKRQVSDKIFEALKKKGFAHRTKNWSHGAVYHDVLEERKGKQALTQGGATRMQQMRGALMLQEEITNSMTEDGRNEASLDADLDEVMPLTKKPTEKPKSTSSAMDEIGAKLDEQAARARKIREQTDEQADDAEQSWTAGIDSKVGATGVTKTPQGTEIPFIYALAVDPLIIASHDANGIENPLFPKQLQPRDRSRPEMVREARERAANLDPDRLGANINATDGAPIVISVANLKKAGIEVSEELNDNDLVVLSGNGRVISRRLVIGKDLGAEYLDFIWGNAKEFGFTQEQVEEISSDTDGDSVTLVREMRTSGVTSAEHLLRIASEANESTVSAMSASEKAMDDASRITEDMLDLWSPSESGDVLAASNNDFLVSFATVVKDKGELRTKSGAWSSTMGKRVLDAMFYKAYGSGDLLNLFTEAADSDIKNIINALSIAAPEFARARAVESDLADLDVISLINEAVTIIRQAKADGVNPEMVLAQGSMLDTDGAKIKDFVVFFQKNNRAFRRMGDALSEIASFIHTELMRRQTQDIFGDENQTLDAIIKRANEALEARFDGEAIARIPQTKPEAESSAPADGDKKGKPKKEPQSTSSEDAEGVVKKPRKPRKEPRKIWKMTEIPEEGVDPEVRQMLEKRNEVRRFVNELSDEDHAKVSNRHLSLLGVALEPEKLLNLIKSSIETAETLTEAEAEPSQVSEERDAAYVIDPVRSAVVGLLEGGDSATAEEIAFSLSENKDLNVKFTEEQAEAILQQLVNDGLLDSETRDADGAVTYERKASKVREQFEMFERNQTQEDIQRRRDEIDKKLTDKGKPVIYEGPLFAQQVKPEGEQVDVEDLAGQDSVIELQKAPYEAETDEFGWVDAEDTWYKDYQVGDKTHRAEVHTTEVNGRNQYYIKLDGRPVPTTRHAAPKVTMQIMEQNMVDIDKMGGVKTLFGGKVVIAKKEKPKKPASPKSKTNYDHPYVGNRDGMKKLNNAENTAMWELLHPPYSVAVPGENNVPSVERWVDAALVSRLNILHRMVEPKLGGKRTMSSLTEDQLATAKSEMEVIRMEQHARKWADEGNRGPRMDSRSKKSKAVKKVTKKVADMSPAYIRAEVMDKALAAITGSLKSEGRSPLDIADALIVMAMNESNPAVKAVLKAAATDKGVLNTSTKLLKKIEDGLLDKMVSEDVGVEAALTKVMNRVLPAVKEYTESNAKVQKELSKKDEEVLAELKESEGETPDALESDAIDPKALESRYAASRVSKLVKDFYAKWGTAPGSSVDVLIRDPSGNPVASVLLWADQDMPGSVVLGGIEAFSVSDFFSRSGMGNRALREVTSWADSHNLPIRLLAYPYGAKTMNRRELTQWYERHGFVAHDNQMMIRHPMKQTETASFQKFYKNAKPRLPDGSPRPLYHGTATNNLFEIFQNNHSVNGAIWGRGFYFTESPQDADKWALFAADSTGNPEFVMKVYVAIKNPFRIGIDGAQVVNWYSKNGTPLNQKTVDILMSKDLMRDRATLDIHAIEHNALHLQEILAKAGFDGITGKFGDTNHWVAFYPTQVKSAIGNRGLYDGYEDSMLERPSEMDSVDNPHSSTSVEASLRDEFGDNFVDQVMPPGPDGAAKQVVLVDNEYDMIVDMQERGSKIAHFEYDGSQGLFDWTTNTTYIVASNLSVDADIPGIFLHEFGAHYGVTNIFGREGFNRIVQDLSILLDNNNQAALSAARAVNSALGLKLDSNSATFAHDFLRMAEGSFRVQHELLAYFTEQNSAKKLPLWARIMAAVKSWMMKNGFGSLASRMSADQIAAFVRGAAMQSAVRPASEMLFTPKDFAERAHPFLKGRDKLDPFMAENGALESTQYLSEFLAEQALESRRVPQTLAAATGFIDQVFNSPGLNEVLDLGWYARSMLHPRTIAALYGEFVPVWDAASDMLQMRLTLEAEMGRMAHDYFSLPKEGKANVDKLLEIGRLQGMNFGSGEISVKVLTASAALSNQGDTITLTPEEVRAYSSVRNTMDYAHNLYKSVIMKRLGYGKPGDPSTPIEFDALARESANIGKTAKAARYMEIRDMLVRFDEMLRKGYVPFSRFGDFGIVVKSRGAELEDGSTEPSKTIEFVRVETQSLFGKTIGRKLNAHKVWDEYNRLVEKYKNQPEYEVHQPFEILNMGDITRHIRLSEIDALAETAGINDQLFYKKVRAELATALDKGSIKRHFLQSSNMPGYSTDFERSMTNYIVGMAGFMARATHGDRLYEAVGAIRGEKLRKYAKKYADYIGEPQEEFQRWRMTTFIYTIMANVSTAFVNATQVPVLTVPFMTQFMSVPEISKQLTVAYRDALAMLKRPEGNRVIYEFDMEAAPLDVREALRRADDAGVLGAQVSYEHMGIIQGTPLELRGMKRKGREIFGNLSSMYTGIERMNRIVSFIAAYRGGIADKAVLGKAHKAFGKSELWSQSFGDAPASAYDLGVWVVEETHFRMGKTNRPAMFRGVGAWVFQFQSFFIQAAEAQYRMAAIYGPEGKKAFAGVMLMLLFFSGIFGLTGADSLKALIENLYRFASDKDLDLEQKIYDALEGVPAGDLMAEAISRGPFRLTGSDLSQRVGMGRIPVIDALIQGVPEDVAGAPVTIMGARGLRSLRYMKDEQYGMAAAEALPNFIKNPINALSWQTQGVKTSGYQLMTPEEMNPAMAIAKAFGFQPTNVTRVRETEWSRRRAETGVRDLQSKYYRRLARALSSDDAGRVDSIMSEIDSYNSRQDPDRWVMIDRGHLRRLVRQEGMGREARARRVPMKARVRSQEISESRPSSRQNQSERQFNAMRSDVASAYRQEGFGAMAGLVEDMPYRVPNNMATVFDDLLDGEDE